MKYRILFYFIYSSVLTSYGYFLKYQIALTDEAKNISFLLLSIFCQYFFSLLFLRAIVWKKLIVTALIWILSYIIGILVLVHFAFNKKPDPADLYGLIAFLLVMFICYEVLAKVNKKLFR